MSNQQQQEQPAQQQQQQQQQQQPQPQPQQAEPAERDLDQEIDDALTRLSDAVRSGTPYDYRQSEAELANLHSRRLHAEAQ